MVGNLIGKIFGTKNDREIKKYQKKIQKINALEKKYQELDDDTLQEEFFILKNAVIDGEKTVDRILEEIFAIVRETSKRTLRMRHFDVQLIGGIVLHEGRIAEMKTGEGKTLVATLPAVLNAIKDAVHIVTVNDYLAQRDAKEMSPLYGFLGFKVGIVNENSEDEDAKRAAYACDIVYGTNNEFGFDYLRDNMKFNKEEMVQGPKTFAIVDEVDSILIDEARTPLVISGPTSRKLDNYVKANSVAQQLKKNVHFTVDEKHKVVLITEEGIIQAEKLFGIDNMYSIENAILSHHLDQALKANNLFEKDVDYIVRNNELIIIDEFTGRISEGRRFSEGLHQALEAKEKVEIKNESQTLADITFQNYFRMYDKLSGMTGTAQTEATEFSEIYGLDVISVPTNVPVRRVDLNDLIYKTEEEKFEAVVIKVCELSKKGQPVLIGTTSIEKSEILSAFLQKANIKHTVLNAKNHAKEGEIIKDAGKKSAVTIATNMAGRGVDIKITNEVKMLDGFYILGTERHENRRIDNQLRGRSGRQGDPGVSQFYLSLEDNLLRIFGADRIKNIMDRLGVEKGEHIESKLVTRSVEKAQKRVESIHFEQRKHLVEYDDVAAYQRNVVYAFRNNLVDKDFNINSKIDENRTEYVQSLLNECGITNDQNAENFDFEKLNKTLKEELKETLKVTPLKALENDVEAIGQNINKELKKRFDEKMTSINNNEICCQIQREIYLQVLDNSYREHLYQMDILKTGIGLRGYNQKDPLVEYKRESLKLFNELINGVKTEVIKTLYLIRFSTQAQEEFRAFEKSMEERHKNEQSQFSTRHNFGLELENKPSRNSPCPCGSGKKYKHCHGKSGPKKGLLAQ